MKLLLMAHDYVGVKITKWLIENYKDDLGLVCVKKPNLISDACDSAGIPWTDATTAEKFDLGILAWWPDIVGDDILNCANHFVNTHPSLLPYCRGKHYNFWTIVEESPFGVTLHKVTHEIDSGPIIAQKKLEYGWEDNGETLFHKAQEAMVDLFSETYPTLRTLSFPMISQRESLASYHRAREINKASRILLNGNYTGREILNLLRARTFTGHPACYFNEDGVKYEVRIDIRREKADG